VSGSTQKSSIGSYNILVRPTGAGEAGGEVKSTVAHGNCMAGTAAAAGVAGMVGGADMMGEGGEAGVGQPEEACEGLGHNGTDRNEAGGEGHEVDMRSESTDGS
jgi:hypothetical protein